MSEPRTHLSHDLDALRFLDALDAGDLEAVAALWEKAAHDPALEQVLKEMDEHIFSQAEREETLLRPAVASLGKGVDEAVVLFRQGKHQESLRQARRAAEAMTLLHPLPEQAEVAVWLNQLGALCLALGEQALAEEAMLSALAVGRALWGSNHPNLARCLHNLAVLEDRQGRYDEAERDYRRALLVLGLEEGIEAAAILGNLGSLCALQGKLEEAATLLRRSLELREKIHGSHHPALAPALRKLGAVFAGQGRPVAAGLRQRAEDVLRNARAGKALGARPAHPPPRPPGVASPADAALSDGRP
jgi:tetratricopeptide (TPR) repeat protein